MVIFVQATVCSKQDQFTLIGSGAGGAGGGANTLVPKNTFRDVFDISCDTGDFRAHIFCPQMTQQLARKHYDTGLNNCLQMHNLSQINYRHCEDWKEVGLCQLKMPRVFWKI